MGTAPKDDENTAYRASEHISLSGPRVWALLTDFTAAPLWLTDVTEMHADAPLGTGVELEVRMGDHARTYTLTGFTPERELLISTGDGDVHTTYGYQLSPDAGGTLLTLTVQVAISPRMEGDAWEIRRAVADAESSQLPAFKRYAELAP